MRVILDTNILLSAFFRADSPPNKLMQAWIAGRFELVTAAIQIEELVRVARYPQIQKLLRPADIGWLVNRLRDHGTFIQRLPKIEVSNDPADNFLFALAQASGASCLVSGDNAGVLVIRQHRDCQVMTARQLVALLKI